MPNASHTDAHGIYDLTAVHFVQVFFQIIGPRAVNMLQASNSMID